MAEKETTELNLFGLLYFTAQFILIVMEKLSSSKKITTLPVQDVQKRVKNIMNVDSPELGDSLNECLNLMGIEVERVRKQANGYPGVSIDAIVWVDGVALASCGETLADFLSTKDFLKEQLRATGLWAKATLSVCSHYHHMVGPAMIAFATVSERAGNIEAAKASCNAVMRDFECILEDAEEDECKPAGEELIAIQSLKSAATKILKLEDDSEMQNTASQIVDRIDSVMLKE